MKKMERRFGHIYYSLVAICIVFSVFLIFESGIIRGLSDEIDYAVERERFNQQKKDVIEGQFVDRDGKAITSKREKGKAAKLLYPEYSYIIGYNSDIYTLSGLRKYYKDYLFRIGNDNEGATLHLTTDNKLMTYAQGLLKEKGSILVLDASGAVSAMVSKDIGQYDANKIDSKWDDYNEREEFLLDRNLIAATPGSTFKMITASCAIEKRMSDYEWEDTGVYLGIHNAGDKNYGRLKMKRAFVKSVNTYFASLGVKMGKQSLTNICKKFYIGIPMNTDFGMLQSDLDFKEGSDPDVAQVSFGAGNTKITPVLLGTISSAICSNNGDMMRPYLVETIFDDGKSVYSHEPDMMGTSVSTQTAKKVKSLMKAAASDYGLNKETCGTIVYAKTGTAQLTDDRKGYNKIWIVASTKKYTIVISYDETKESSHSLIEPAKQLIQFMEGRG